MSSLGMRAIVLLAVALVAVSVPGCVICGERCELVDLRTETHSVDLDGAERVVIHVDMGIGELMIGGGAESLVDTEFEYNVLEWRPEVTYEATNGRGVLHITQPDAEGKSAPDGAKNRWLIALSNDVPIELEIDSGVGGVKLDLGDVMLTDLEVDHGVGEVMIDLAGKHSGDMTASVDGGIGEISVIVPSNVGVRLDGDTGIGRFKAAGFMERGGTLVNNAYGESGETIRLSIDAGIGEVKVLTDEV